MKYAAIVEYDGSTFSGWQRQSHAPSVQAAVELAVSQVANHEVLISCAGRTDAGVHALGQVIHFESDAKRSLRSWLLGANANLPASVSIKKVIPVKQDFHARFSARQRSYRYVINNESVRSALLVNKAVWEFVPLDDKLMAQSAQYLLGRHDFTSFRALACQANNPVREITRLRVTREGQLVIIDVSANAFLQHMVRNIAGVLISVGKQEHPPKWVAEVLARKDRSCAAVTAPAGGLYFMSVQYDPQHGI